MDWYETIILILNTVLILGLFYHRTVVRNLKAKMENVIYGLRSGDNSDESTKTNVTNLQNKHEKVLEAINDGDMVLNEDNDGNVSISRIKWSTK